MTIRPIGLTLARLPSRWFMRPSSVCSIRGLTAFFRPCESVTDRADASRPLVFLPESFRRCSVVFYHCLGSCRQWLRQRSANATPRRRPGLRSRRGRRRRRQLSMVPREGVLGGPAAFMVLRLALLALLFSRKFLNCRNKFLNLTRENVRVPVSRILCVAERTARPDEGGSRR